MYFNSLYFPAKVTFAAIQSSPYFLRAMWIIWAVSVAGTLFSYLRNSTRRVWNICAVSLCFSSFNIVLATGGLDSLYFLLLYVAMILCSLKGTYHINLFFCVISTVAVYLTSGTGLRTFTDIGYLTKLILLPFFAIVSFFVNSAITKPMSDTEKQKDERVEEAYAIARNQVAEKEESENLYFDRQRKLYSLMQLFHKLSKERSAKVIEENVVYFAREEVKSQIAFIAFSENGKWKTPRFLGINEVMAQNISTRIEAGVFNKVLNTGEIINFSNVKYHTQTRSERQPFDSTIMAMRNLLVVPLQDASGGKPFGVLAVANKLMGSKYDKQDEDYLSLLATEAAITIRNLTLYEKLNRSYYETILALAQSIEAKDSYTHGHVSRVEQLSFFICRCIGLDDSTTELVAKAAILHDVGKISIPDSILMKNSSLTKEEFEVMKTHTSNARLILNNITSLPPEVTDIVVHHHERYDGCGYPDGLKGQAIPLGSQIISIADSFDAMTTTRPYRKALSVQEAFKRLEDNSGTQFSPYILDKFLLNVKKVKNLADLPHYFEQTDLQKPD